MSTALGQKPTLLSLSDYTELYNTTTFFIPHFFLLLKSTLSAIVINLVIHTIHTPQKLQQQYQRPLDIVTTTITFTARIFIYIYTERERGLKFVIAAEYPQKRKRKRTSQTPQVFVEHSYMTLNWYVANVEKH